MMRAARTIPVLLSGLLALLSTAAQAQFPSPAAAANAEGSAAGQSAQAASAAHSTLRPTDTVDLGFRQRMGAALPLGVALRDGGGRLVRLGDFFRGEPVVLVLDYLRCRTLCGVVLEHTVSALAHTPLVAGRDYQVVAISIDPRDGPAEVRAARAKYLDGLAPASAAAWHFLTGSDASVHAVAEAVGFHYRYDPAIDQFAHPAGIMLATPRGTIARYLLGVGFRPLDLRLGLAEARQGRISSPVSELLLLCYCYDPQTGRYSIAISNTTRALCAATVLGIGLMMFRLSRRPRTA